MTTSAKLHDVMDRWNILKKPTEKIAEYFAYHPQVFKIALVANHFFRTAAMFFMMGSPLAWPICIGGSIFYRLTVEKNCAFKFALPALGGAISLMIANPALAALINGVAFSSIAAFAIALLTLIPLGVYLAYVILTVNYEVDHRPCPFCPNPG